MRATAPLRQLRPRLDDALRYWEPRRIAYNVLLATVVLAWLGLTWPHFRGAFTVQVLVLLIVLAALANVCYCAAYLVDIPLQYSSFGGGWRRWRWALWLGGALFAVILANYWISY